MRAAWAIVLLAAVALVASCGDTEEPVPLRSWEPTEAEVGDVLVISVSSNPGIGDAWQIASGPDEAVVRFVDTDYEDDRPGEVGGGGTDTFRFEAVGAGRTTIVLHNCFRCDDEGNTPPEYADEVDDLVYEVTVR